MAKRGYWLEVSVVTDGEAAEAVAELLQPLGDVVMEQRGDASSLDPNALEADITVKVYLPEDQDSPAVRQQIREAIYHMGRLYPIPEPTFREVEEEDWAEAWKAHYKPFRVGRRIWIQPSWVEDRSGSGADDVVLTLDPGMAFGTGLHPTTQMCLQALEELVTPGCAVLDVGAGSGILSVAAARLGAGEVVAVDTDAKSVEATQENATRNGVGAQIDVRRGSLETVGEHGWDLVVVNILAPVIVAMVQEANLLRYPERRGHLILSGIIDQQLPAVEGALESEGGSVVKRLQVRDWVTLIASPSAA